MTNHKRILFNCSTNIIGGGIKNAVLFIQIAIRENKFDWRFAISSPVKELLHSNCVSLDSRFEVFKESPSRDRKARKKLHDFAVKEKVLLVYTMAGPTYVHFPMYHIQGLSNAYITNMSIAALAFKAEGSPYLYLKHTIKSLIQLSHSMKADFFIFQTDFAKNGYRKRTFTNESKCKVINNAFDSDMLKNFTDDKCIKRKNNNSIIIFCPGSAYKHKGFQLIPRIALELKNLVGKRFIFKLTLPNSDLQMRINKVSKDLGVEELIENHGPFKYSDISTLFEESDIIFVPSLFETFSATYLEAMVAFKPLLVADRKFAKDICKDYAHYCDPENPQETALVFKTMFETKLNLDRTKKRAMDILKEYGSHKERYDKIQSLIMQKINEIEIKKL